MNMTLDREALIHAIELRENIAKRDHHGFVDFTYEMVGDVLTLLKEQEAVSPLFVSGDGQFFCGACKFPLGVSGVNFCSGCGRQVKWT